MIKRLVLRWFPAGKDGDFVVFSDRCAWRGVYLYFPVRRKWLHSDEYMDNYYMWRRWAHLIIDPCDALYVDGVCRSRGPAVKGSVFGRMFCVPLPHYPWSRLPTGHKPWWKLRLYKLSQWFICGIDGRYGWFTGKYKR